MSLEMTRGPLLEVGEDPGDFRGGAGGGGGEGGVNSFY